MPVGHSSFATLKKRRLRPSLVGWGLAAAGAGLLLGSAVAPYPHQVAALALASLATGLAAWREGRRVGLVVGTLVGLPYVALAVWQAGPTGVEIPGGVAGLLGLLALAVALAEMGHVVDALTQSAQLDQATHLPNYDLFMRFLELEASRSLRYRLPFCVVVLELQDMDSYSRAFGYWRTDRMLKELAKTMSETLRKSDVLARLGGPQFALLLPMTKSDGALVALQRVQSAVQVLGLPAVRGVKLKPITWRAGVAEFPGDGQSPRDLLSTATEHLGPRAPEQPALPSP